MQTLALIGVPFDGYGRPGNQSRAAAVLREAGLEAAFGPRDRATEPNMVLPEPEPGRATPSGLINEPALLAMTDAVYHRVSAALATEQFPLVYGADCTILLGAIPALRDTTGEAALLFADGHEDTTSQEATPDGEAANMEIGFLLGITGSRLPDQLQHRLPALSIPTLALFGQRDAAFRQQFDVPSLAERGVWHRSPEEIAAAPTHVARETIAHLAASTANWWLHIDLDVLAEDEFAAQGLPGEKAEPGGLRWSDVTEATIAALQTGGCRGLSVVIYDPDQDPDRTDARRIVRFMTDIAPFLP